MRNKIYIRGVDELKTDDIRSFAMEHYPTQLPVKIEWIDDTSANIIYDSSETAADALFHFSLDTSGDLTDMHGLQLRVAKRYSAHPESSLQVRTAVITDKKQPMARLASKFYLKHPELDPGEKRRRSSRHGQHGRDRKARYGDDEERRRRRRDNDEGFTASMYDDDADAVESRNQAASNRRNSRSSFSSDLGSEGFRGDSYRPRSGDRRRLRDRSASPTRESNGQNGRRERRRTPPPRYNTRDPHPFPRANAVKELFPSKAVPREIGDDIRGISATTDTKELFPNKQAATNLKKELFPLKTGIGNHRRSDAFDAADETADLFASGMAVPFIDGAHDSLPQHGRLKASDPDPDPEDLENLQQGGISIRGAAKKVDRGISIRGAASQVDRGISIRGTASSSTVKELFPAKAGNAGKELFAEKLQGRGGKRNLAADMFY